MDGKIKHTKAYHVVCFSCPSIEEGKGSHKSFALDLRRLGWKKIQLSAWTCPKCLESIGT